MREGRKRLKRAVVLITGLASVLALTAHAVEKKSGAEPKYPYVQVNRFAVQEGVDLPPDYQLEIVEDLNKELGKIKGLKQVFREGEDLPKGQPALVLTGTVTKYQKGSQAKRYLVGFGAGETVIGAHLKCYDAATHEVLFEKDVDGRVVMGIMGGKSEGANNGLAKEIVKDIKKEFF